jgi:hypothetical protein
MIRQVYLKKKYQFNRYTAVQIDKTIHWFYAQIYSKIIIYLSITPNCLNNSYIKTRYKKKEQKLALNECKNKENLQKFNK